MSIKNRYSFTHVNFLPPSEFKLIGEYAGQQLLLIGRAKAYGDPIVATCQTNEPIKEDLSAYDLYELMKLSDNTVRLTEEFRMNVK